LPKSINDIADWNPVYGIAWLIVTAWQFYRTLIPFADV
jgi:hypothetical protein